LAELSCAEADSENLLIQGNNLDALKALLPYYAGRVTCGAAEYQLSGESCVASARPRAELRGNGWALRQPVGPAMLRS
jgi:hypothetical protein